MYVIFIVGKTQIFKLEQALQKTQSNYNITLYNCKA